MPISVSDGRSNLNDQIAYAAKAIGRSHIRRKVFEAIYKGKKKVKSVSEIANATKLSRKQILNYGKQLENKQIVIAAKKDGEKAWKKDDFYAGHKQNILRLAGNKDKLREFPTKYNQRNSSKTITIKVPRSTCSIESVTIDDIESFARVQNATNINDCSNSRELECVIKKGFKKILGEKGKFSDWGGETNDLYTTKVRLQRKRIFAAFAFKGKGTRGKLVPAKMGRNGDQIQRLFQSSACLFMIQYVGQIDESVVTQMQELAKARSVSTGQKIYYGVIDGQDTQRIMNAYPKAFC